MKQLFFLLLLLLLMSACKKLVETDGPQKVITSEEAFGSNASARKVVLGLYDQIAKEGFLNSIITRVVSVYGAEVVSRSGRDLTFAQGKLSADNEEISKLYFGAYGLILQFNGTIEGLNKAVAVSDSVKAMLSGEVYFMRAFCYFYLVNLFNAVPLLVSGDYEAYKSLPRRPVAEVYDQIEQDLLDALVSLPDRYELFDASATNRTRIDVWAARALMARVCLYRRRWADAEKYASALIDCPLFALENEVGAVFRFTSPETILQIKPVDSSGIAPEAATFISMDGAPPDYYLTLGLHDRFKNGDARKLTWLSPFLISNERYFAPDKYKRLKDPPQYNVMLRLSEQYLIRAEARLYQGKLEGTAEDINWVRERAGLTGIEQPVPIAALMDSLLDIRRTELFAEWGHRFFDMKRCFLAADSIEAWYPGLRDQLPPGFASEWWRFAFPLPARALKENSKLIQNQGYY